MDHKYWLTFLDSIDQARAQLKCDASGAWFRGVSSHKFRLYPSLLRPRAKITVKQEREIFERAEDFDSNTMQKNDSWERLVTLQHYGAPTRLLDWTETFGVALYFAVRGIKGDISPTPAIWILNPFRLAQLARRTSDKTIGVFHKDRATDYYESFIGGAQLKWPFESPMPYRPPKISNRIRAQRGFFTVHGADPRPIDAIFRESVRQVRIPRDAICFARQFLQLAGIDSLALFPDFEGFNRMLKDRYE
jgi:FRG domain